MVIKIYIGLSPECSQESEWAAAHICHVLVDLGSYWTELQGIDSNTRTPSSITLCRLWIQFSPLAAGMRAILGCDIHHLIHGDNVGVNSESYADAKEDRGEESSLMRSELSRIVALESGENTDTTWS